VTYGVRRTLYYTQYLLSRVIFESLRGSKSRVPASESQRYNSLQTLGLLALDRDAEGARAEDHEEELGEPAGGVLNEEDDGFIF